MPRFQDIIASLIDSAKEKLADGFSIAKLGQVLQAFLVEAMKAAAVYLKNEGPFKKQLVLEALATAFDALPLPWWLALVRAPLKSIVLTIADGAIEAIYSQFKDSINEGAVDG